MSHLRLGIRRLRATPGFTIAAVVTLALGIGANTLTFSAIRGMLLRPLSFPQADRLAWIYGQNVALGTSGERVSWEESNRFAKMASFEAVAVIGSRSLIRPEGDRRVEWKGLSVTASLFSLLGVKPAVGRSFSAEDMPSTATTPAMVLGYERWQRDFGGDPSVLGLVVQFADKKAGRVVGALPPGLEFPLGRSPGAGSGTEFSVGVQDFWVLSQDRPDDYPDGFMLARLKGDVTARAAAAEAATVALDVNRTLPQHAGRSFAVVSLRDHALGLMRPALPLLQGFAALVILIACANLANLVLARAASGRTEYAIRLALGARTLDLLKVLLSESLLLSIGGAAVGVVLAWLGQRLLTSHAEGTRGHTSCADARLADGCGAASAESRAVVVGGHGLSTRRGGRGGRAALRASFTGLSVLPPVA